MNFIPDFAHDSGSYLFWAFVFAALIQLIFLLLIFSRVSFHRSLKQERSFNAPVSVIIAARNESGNLYKNLPFILEQDYPEFEVIVINHQSIDDSYYILDAYKQQYPQLRTIEVNKSEHLKYGKKLPLTLGIKGAKYEHLLFTDADCKPATNQWLRSMVSLFSERKEIVLGFGPYRKEKGFLNRLIRFDTTWIAINYFSFAKAGLPYMGIGRNMAYTRSVFNEVKGFKSHYALSSGDDDLFIQEAAVNKNYTINLEPDAYCFSDGASSWEKWFGQKSRHYTTAERYKVIKKLMLGIYPLSLLVMLFLFVILLFDERFTLLTLAIFVFITSLKWAIIGKAFARLNAGSFIAWLPLWDIFYALWTPIVYYSVDRSDTKKW